MIQGGQYWRKQSQYWTPSGPRIHLWCSAGPLRLARNCLDRTAERRRREPDRHRVDDDGRGPVRPLLSANERGLECALSVSAAPTPPQSAPGTSHPAAPWRPGAHRLLVEARRRDLRPRSRARPGVETPAGPSQTVSRHAWRRTKRVCDEAQPCVDIYLQGRNAVVAYRITPSKRGVVAAFALAGHP
jgi:hypothetical protein